MHDMKCKPSKSAVERVDCVDNKNNGANIDVSCEYCECNSLLRQVSGCLIMNGVVVNVKHGEHSCQLLWCGACQALTGSGRIDHVEDLRSKAEERQQGHVVMFLEHSEQHWPCR